MNRDARTPTALRFSTLDVHEAAVGASLAGEFFHSRSARHSQQEAGSYSIKCYSSRLLEIPGQPSP